MQDSPKRIANENDLPKLIGYRELRESYGLSKSTILDWIRKRQFPKPADFPGKRAVWFLDDVLAWLEVRRRGLIAAATSDPSRLTPDQIDKTHAELGALIVERVTGRATSSAEVRTAVMFELSPAEQSAAVAANEAAAKAERLETNALFSSLDLEQAMIVANGVFPALRAHWASGNDSRTAEFDLSADADGAQELANDVLEAAEFELAKSNKTSV